MTAAKRIVRLTDSLVNIAIGFVLFVILLYGGYALWDTYAVFDKASIGSEIMHYKPTVENPTLDELHALNPDVQAWLSIDDTNIDYPVVQGPDNSKYLDKDFYGEYSLGGSIFLDFMNSPDFSDFYNLLYGHHMDGGAMFGDVKEFEDKAFFDTHSTGLLVTRGKTYDLEIFSCMAVSAYDPYIFNPGVPDIEKRQELLSYISENSLHYIEKNISTDDHIIALSTCSTATTNGRTIVIAKMVEHIEAGGE